MLMVPAGRVGGRDSLSFSDPLGQRTDREIVPYCVCEIVDYNLASVLRLTWKNGGLLYLFVSTPHDKLLMDLAG